MSKQDFDWTLIRSFLAVMEAGSLMGAARQLGAHQPTLGRHVAELEAQLGGSLFERPDADRAGAPDCRRRRPDAGRRRQPRPRRTGPAK